MLRETLAIIDFIIDEGPGNKEFVYLTIKGNSANKLMNKPRIKVVPVSAIIWQPLGQKLMDEETVTLNLNWIKIINYY